MPPRTDKFAWIKAVRRDQRLTTADRYVLQNAALEYVNYQAGDDSFYARQTTMAERFGVGLRTVQRAIAQGKKFGYLVVEQPRRRGRGYHDADFHRLVIPQVLPANQAGNTDVDAAEIPANQAGNSAEIPANQAEIPANQAEIPANAEPSTCGNDTPKGWLKRVKNKGGQENKGGCAFSDENAVRNDNNLDVDFSQDDSAKIGKATALESLFGGNSSSRPTGPQRCLDGSEVGTYAVTVELCTWCEENEQTTFCAPFCSSECDAAEREKRRFTEAETVGGW